MQDLKFCAGGVYFDTDVEVIRSLDEILEAGPFLGEQSNGRVAAGLGMAAEPNMLLFLKMVELYDKLEFNLSVDSDKQITVVQHVTNFLIQHGYDPERKGIQKVLGINIYPPEYFNPKDYKTGTLIITPNTFTIHHFAESWKPSIERNLHRIEKTLTKRMGKVGAVFAYGIGLPYWIYKKVKSSGFKGTLDIIRKKMTRETRINNVLYGKENSNDTK